MANYLVLLKIDPTKTRDVLNAFKRLPKNPHPGVNLYWTMNLFGTWDTGIWFYAKNHDQAMNFVQKKICAIPGIHDTYTMPTTPIKEYTESLK